MKVLALDISSHAGYALVLQKPDGELKLVERGVVDLGRPVTAFGAYPQSLHLAAKTQAEYLMGIVNGFLPDVVVVEETNLGKNRYSQKFLEYTHAHLLNQLYTRKPDICPVAYVDTSAWRKALGLRLDAKQKKDNAKLSKEKKKAAEKKQKLDKKALGIKGKVTWKHLSVDHANKTFGLALKQKDNDVADAINIALAYLKNAPLCDGV